MKNDVLAYWLVMNRLPGMGPRRFATLLEEVTDLSCCFNGTQASKDFVIWCTHHGIKKLILDWAGVEKDLAWAENRYCTILHWENLAYPHALKHIASKPLILFVKGQVTTLHSLQIAMVGSRHPTQMGIDNAYQFSFELAQQGFTITSGLALGIDAGSHEGALAAKGITIGVLGNSLDRIYPTKHSLLAERIIQQGGALVSEFPLGTPPKAEHFPQRNRIISGLSLGVVVVESALKSGSLITAQYALEQNREVFALPGSLHNPLAKGCNQLIRQGAKCVENVTHILEELPIQPSIIETKKENIPSLQRVIHPLLPYIENICTPIDTILAKTGLTLNEVSSMLLELELQEEIVSIPGGYIKAIKR